MVIPVEVKAQLNLKAKSLRVYREKYHPQLSVRTSMADYRREEGLVNLPLYAIGELGRICEQAWAPVADGATDHRQE